MTRRGMVALLTTICSGRRSYAFSAATGELEALERWAGGKLGVFAVEVESNRALAWRAEERFLMCSTFKLLAAAATLIRVDAGDDDLSRLVPYSTADLVDPHPVTGANVQTGALPLGALCEAAVTESDSAAANLLMSRLGGPRALTACIRRWDDRTTRVDRYEPAANSPEGELDTTSPRAMALSVRRLLLLGSLQRGSAEALEAWMRNDRRGANRIRAGVPKAWVVGSKPGTSDTSTNDVAVLRRPGSSPVIVAAYYLSPPAELARRERVLRQVGQVVARWATST